MTRTEPYDPLDYGNPARSSYRIFRRGNQPARLPPAESFIGSGVYAAYYMGALEFHASVSSADINTPIYVGKADGRGGRNGSSAGKETIGTKLFNRLLIVSKGVVVVQIFVSQRQSMHPLAQHRQHLVANLPALASVAQAARHLSGQPQPAVYLVQQQRTAMRGNRTAGEIRPYPPPPAP